MYIQICLVPPEKAAVQSVLSLLALLVQKYKYCLALPEKAAVHKPNTPNTLFRSC
jgi:hypothetical protein